MSSWLNRILSHVPNPFEGGRSTKWPGWGYLCDAGRFRKSFSMRMAPTRPMTQPAK